MTDLTAIPNEVLSHYDMDQLTRLMRQEMLRAVEGLRLYRPMPKQEAFHRSEVSERIIRGSNRSGKTTAALVEIARAACTLDPHKKYPEAEGRIVCVAKSEALISQVFFRKLFRRGAYKIIRDEATGDFRAYNPDQDADREREARPSLPLIPKRLVKEISWQDKKKQVPNIVRLKTGWEILFFTAASPPPTGIDVDIVLFDEEVEGQDWYPEMSARLVDRKGKFIWSATPEAGTEHLYDLSIRANDPDDIDVEEFFVTLMENPHIALSEKEKLKRKFKGLPEAYQVKIEGKFAVLSYRMYPQFSMSRDLHGADPVEIMGMTHDGEIVDKDIYDLWIGRFNRYMIVDPGRQVCAVLFMCVPPPEHELSDQRFFYDELYIRECDAVKFANAVREKVEGIPIHESLIDPSATKKQIGPGSSVLSQYTEELRTVGFEAATTGASFNLASNDIKGGVAQMRRWMAVQAKTHRPILKVIDGRLPNFLWEIDRYRRKKKAGELTDDPVDRNDHLMDAARYAAMRDPKWTTPLPVSRGRNFAVKFLDEWESRIKSQGRHSNYVKVGA